MVQAVGNFWSYECGIGQRARILETQYYNVMSTSEHQLSASEHLQKETKLFLSSLF